MTSVWKWPGAVLGLLVGVALLIAFGYVFLAIGLPALAVSWWGLLYVGPVVADIAILVAAVLLSRGSTRVVWVVVRNLLVAVWIADVLILCCELVLAGTGHWPIF